MVSLSLTAAEEMLTSVGELLWSQDQGASLGGLLRGRDVLLSILTYVDDSHIRVVTGSLTHLPLPTGTLRCVRMDVIFQWAAPMDGGETSGIPLWMVESHLGIPQWILVWSDLPPIGLSPSPELGQGRDA